jgi:hypothetical protein
MVQLNPTVISLAVSKLGPNPAARSIRNLKDPSNPVSWRVRETTRAGFGT